MPESLERATRLTGWDFRARQAITGQRFDDLFQEALYSTAPVPLDGTFLWVNHYPGE